MCTIWRKDGKKIHIWKIVHSEIFFFFEELHLGSTLFLKYLCRSFWLCWVSVAGCWLSVVVVLGCFSSRGVQASHCSGVSYCRAWALRWVAAVLGGVWAQWMCTGLVALPHRDQTGVPCIAQQAVNHWTTREAPFWNFLFFLYKSYLESLFLFF